eukprot:1567022-Prorocentrum_lima.AAC.1
MTSSLVGSEMCIRDRDTRGERREARGERRRETGDRRHETWGEGRGETVSYTHLTLPTICSV